MNIQIGNKQFKLYKSSKGDLIYLFSEHNNKYDMGDTDNYYPDISDFLEKNSSTFSQDMKAFIDKYKKHEE